MKQLQMRWEHLLYSLLLLTYCPLQALAGPGNTPYGGNGVGDGKNIAANLVGNEDIQSKVLGIIRGALDIMGTIAVAMIILAGIYLLVGGSTEDGREKARKIILYTFIGLVVILLANAYVRFLIGVAF